MSGGGEIVHMLKNVGIGKYGDHIIRVYFVVGRRGLVKRVLFVCSH